MGSEKLNFQRKRLILRGLAAKRRLNFWKFGCGTTVPHFSKLGEGLERHKKKAHFARGELYSSSRIIMSASGVSQRYTSR